MRHALVVALVAIATVPAIAVAQPAPPPTPAAAADAPKPQCTQPDAFPGRLASDTRKQKWKDNVDAYIGCMRKFVDEQRTLGKLHYDAANAAVEKVNKDVAEFNAATKE